MTGDGWAGGLARWGLGGAGVLALHLAGGYWLIGAMQRGDVPGVPKPVTVEMTFAPLPVPGPAPVLSEEATEPAPDPQSAPEPETAGAAPPDAADPPPEDLSGAIPDPAPDFTPPPLTELPPVTDSADLLPESALLLSASERPMARPPRRAPEPRSQRQETRRAETRPKPQRPAQQRPEPQPQQPAQAQPGPQPAQNAGGAQPQRQGDPAADRKRLASWQAQVSRRISSHMARTRIRGRGVRVQVQVSVSIAANGATRARLAGSTGNPQLDAALARQAGRMPSMPAPPGGRATSFILPINVKLR